MYFPYFDISAEFRVLLLPSPFLIFLSRARNYTMFKKTFIVVLLLLSVFAILSTFCLAQEDDDVLVDDESHRTEDEETVTFSDEDEDLGNDNLDDDEDYVKPPVREDPTAIDPYPEDEDDEDSKIWPPPMPEIRHLKQYKVRMLKEFLDLRGTTCDACAEKDDWVQRVIDTWDWPKKEVTVTSSKTPGDEMTPEEEVAEEARLKRMMEELNGGKTRDYSGMDPKKAKLLKKLQSKGLSFMGGEDMDIEQLAQLVNAMEGINNKNSGDL